MVTGDGGSGVGAGAGADIECRCGRRRKVTERASDDSESLPRNTGRHPMIVGFIGVASAFGGDVVSPGALLALPAATTALTLARWCLPPARWRRPVSSAPPGMRPELPRGRWQRNRRGCRPAVMASTATRRCGLRGAQRLRASSRASLALALVTASRDAPCVQRVLPRCALAARSSSPRSARSGRAGRSGRSGPLCALGVAQCAPLEQGGSSGRVSGAIRHPAVAEVTALLARLATWRDVWTCDAPGSNESRSSSSSSSPYGQIVRRIVGWRRSEQAGEHPAHEAPCDVDEREREEVFELLRRQQRQRADDEAPIRTDRAQARGSRCAERQALRNVAAIMRNASAAMRKRSICCHGQITDRAAAMANHDWLNQ